MDEHLRTLEREAAQDAHKYIDLGWYVKNRAGDHNRAREIFREHFQHVANKQEQDAIIKAYPDLRYLGLEWEIEGPVWYEREALDYNYDMHRKRITTGFTTDSDWTPFDRDPTLQEYITLINAGREKKLTGKLQTCYQDMINKHEYTNTRIWREGDSLILSNEDLKEIRFDLEGWMEHFLSNEYPELHQYLTGKPDGIPVRVDLTGANKNWDRAIISIDEHHGPTVRIRYFADYNSRGVRWRFENG